MYYIYIYIIYFHKNTFFTFLTKISRDKIQLIWNFFNDSQEDNLLDKINILTWTQFFENIIMCKKKR